MPASDLDVLGAQIARFLERALTTPDRDQDVAESAYLCGALQTALDAEARWDASTGEKAKARWDQGLERVGRYLAGCFRETPERWAALARLIRVFVRAVWLEEHPLAQKHMQRRLPGAPVLHYVQLDVLKPFMRALLRAASGEERIALFGQIKDWEVWRALADALAPMAMSSDELVALFHTFDVFSRNDGARGEIFEKLMAWAGEHPEVTKPVVDAWVRGEPRVSKLDREAVRLLIEAVVEQHGDDADTGAWRDQVIEALARRKDEGSWKLAALVACFAWPKATLTAKRHELLLQHVERFPEHLVKIGLWAMTRDAREHPAESIATTRKLLAMIPAAADPEHPLIVAQIADRALHGARDRGIGTTLVAPLLEPLLLVPPEHGSRGLGLDSFLAMLLEEDATAARAFLARWLTQHASAFIGQVRSLEDYLPLLADRLGPAQEATWIVGFIVAPSAELRATAIFLLAARRAPPVSPEAFAPLDDQQARALAHLLAGGPILGRTWIPALIQLALAKPAVFDVVRSILLEDAALNYPASCRSAIKGIEEAKDRIDPPRAALRQLGADLRTRLEELDAAYQQRHSIGEIISYRPASDAWHKVEQRRLEASFRDAQKQFLFMQFATKIPVARGSQSLLSPEQSTPSEMKELSFSMELPIGELVDPLGARLSRAAHYARGEALLAEHYQERTT